MNEQTKSALRTLLKVAGSVLVTRGLIQDDPAIIEAVSGAVVILIGAAWSYWQHRG